MRTRPADADRGITASYWMLKLADALDSGDALMVSAAQDQLRALGFDVRPHRDGRRRS
jgi:hypothetical protein